MTAYIITFFIPGLGHVITEHTKRGFTILITFFVGSFLLSFILTFFMGWYGVFFSIPTSIGYQAWIFFDLKKLLNEKDDDKYFYDPKTLRK